MFDNINDVKPHTYYANPQKLMPLDWYLRYRKMGYNPFNAYSATLAQFTNRDDKIKRLQRVADWINRR